ncbi:Protein kinase superfamily protein [Trifolium repens]|nr:Protein kinase superfamily protein [Trifolium repens]
MEKVKTKLAGWMARHLSLAGSITLAKFVIKSLPIYPMMLMSMHIQRNVQMKLRSLGGLRTLTLPKCRGNSRNWKLADIVDEHEHHWQHTTDKYVGQPFLKKGRDWWKTSRHCLTMRSDKNGEPVILDPACYYGHNEVEFGMSWCAGFGASFYNSYFEVIPKQPGFEKRRDLYLLYHYLNHYNLFGFGY